MTADKVPFLRTHRIHAPVCELDELREGGRRLVPGYDGLGLLLGQMVHGHGYI